MPAGSYLGWDDAKREKIITQYKENKISMHSLAQIHNCGLNTIRRLLKNNGIEIKDSPGDNSRLGLRGNIQELEHQEFKSKEKQAHYIVQGPLKGRFTDFLVKIIEKRNEKKWGIKNE